MHSRTRRMLWVYLLVSGWIPGVASTADLSPEERAAENAVRLFCDLEFVGSPSPEHIDVVAFTDEKKAARLNGHDKFGYVPGVLDIEIDLIDIVAWYRIRSIEVAGESGTAMVEYQKLGEIKGFGGVFRIVKAHARQETGHREVATREEEWQVAGS